MGLLDMLLGTRYSGPHFIVDGTNLTPKEYGWIACDWSINAATHFAHSIIEVFRDGNPDGLGIRFEKYPFHLHLQLIAAGIAIYRVYPVKFLGISKHVSDEIYPGIDDWIENGLKIDGQAANSALKDLLKQSINNSSVLLLSELMSSPLFLRSRFASDVAKRILSAYEKNEEQPNPEPNHAVAETTLTTLIDSFADATIAAIRDGTRLGFSQN